MTVFNNGRELVPIEGSWFIERDVLGIIERMQNYDHNIRVMYLDPDKADFNDAPWIIAEECPDGQVRRIFECWELNETAFERLVRADTQKFQVLDRLEREEATAKAEAQRRFKDRTDEAKDILAHLVASPRVRYSFPNDQGEVVTVDDTIGIVKRDGKSI